MASLIFAHSKSIVNSARKAASKRADLAIQLGQPWKDAYNEAYELELSIAYRQFDEYLNVAKELHNRYSDFVSKPNEKSYFITIRPNDKLVTFDAFQAKITEYVQRKCFKSYTLSYEQKGTSNDTLGSGFHCHIVAKMTQRSKNEVLRDTLSTFNKWIDNSWIAANCISVDVTKNGEQLISNYLVDYKSDDDHKITTKSWDTIWRTNNNIPDLITG